MKLTLQKPLNEFRVNQYFGQNMVSFYAESGLKGHNGIDFYAPDSTPVYATHDGRVTFAGYDDAGGLGIVIRTNEQFEYEGGEAYFKTIYWHLKKDTLKVTGGQSVKAGDLIALADNTGRSTGSHLHFALKPIAKGENDWIWYNLEQNNGYFGAIDPMPFFNEPLHEVEPIKPTLTETLRKGSRGEQVRILQILLKVGVDGIFGVKTETAVKAFQSSHGLVVDGIVGKLTRAKLIGDN